jgi:hypothetical protein
VAWLIVLSDAAAARWVLESSEMAFRSSAGADRLRPGDPFAIYVSRSAHNNPTRDQGQVVAAGTIDSNVEPGRLVVAGKTFEQSCKLSFELVLPLRAGVPFRPLVAELNFIRSKRGWAAYLRRTLLRVPAEDFARIVEAIRAEVNSRSEIVS